MGDFNGDNYGDPFMGQLVNFVASNKFQTMFENYFITFAMEFSNDEEHKLRYYELYQDFHDLFEKQLEEFCDSIGCSQAEFMRKCRESSTEDAKAKHYINILMSSVEYDTFVKLMRIMRPVAAQRAALKADMKNVSDDGGAAAASKGGEPAKGGVSAKDDSGSGRYAADEKVEQQLGSPARAEGKFSAGDDEISAGRVSGAKDSGAK